MYGNLSREQSAMVLDPSRSIANLAAARSAASVSTPAANHRDEAAGEWVSVMGAGKFDLLNAVGMDVAVESVRVEDKGVYVCKMVLAHRPAAGGDAKAATLGDQTSGICKSITRKPTFDHVRVCE